MFSVHTTPKKIKNAIINGHFGFRKTHSSWEIARLCRLRKATFSNRFSCTVKRETGIFKLLSSVFRDRLVWTAGIKIEIKLRFQISTA